MMPFRRMAGMVGFVIAVLIGSELCARHIAISLGLSSAWKIVFGGILPSMTATAVAVWLESSLVEGDHRVGILLRLGLGSPRFEQIKVGAICLVPIAVAYLAMFLWLHVSSTTVASLPLVILKFIFAQGIFEEIVFRGFVFRRLRAGRSFLRAATLSAILFSAFHLTNLIHGVSWEMLIGVTISMAFSFFVAFPAAYLFERGGNVIWGFSLLHVGIDSINWFPKASEPGSGMVIYLLALLVSSLLVFRLGGVLPSGQDEKVT